MEPEHRRRFRRRQPRLPLVDRKRRARVRRLRRPHQRHLVRIRQRAEAHALDARVFQHRINGGIAMRRRAFTLIELVLSMALAAGLAAALYRSMSTLWRAKRVAQAAVEPARAGSIAMDIIARDLSSVPS